MKLIITSTLTTATETIELEGNALTTPIDTEDLNTYIREFANDHEITESSVTYEVLPDAPGSSKRSGARRSFKNAKV